MSKASLREVGSEQIDASLPFDRATEQGAPVYVRAITQGDTLDAERGVQAGSDVWVEGCFFSLPDGGGVEVRPMGIESATILAKLEDVRLPGGASCS